MGILNITPDSFYDGGRYFSVDSAVRHAERMVEEGVDIIDIGGESTRPGSEPVSLEEELRRVIPVIERLKIDPPTFPRSIELRGKDLKTPFIPAARPRGIREGGGINIPISIDTQKAEVARQALESGASIVNDVSAMRNDPRMIDVVRKYNVPVVIMHMKGTPENMQENPYYDDVIGEIKEFFRERILEYKYENIILDPGIGFGKRQEDNFEILRRLGEFKEFGLPILVGPSRKSFIGTIDRLWGTAGAVAVSVMNGANIVRVHDVAQMKQVVEMVEKIGVAKHSFA